jgi:hypothetical protein
MLLGMGSACATDAAKLHPALETQLQVPEITREHPRLMFTPESLALLKERVRRQADPWHRASQEILREAETAAGSFPEPNTGRHSLEFYHDAVRQGEQARLLAYAWLLSEEDRFAEAAIRFLVAWATANPAPSSDFDPQIRFPGTGMEVARAAIPFVETYDLVAGHPAFTREQKDAVEGWFRLLIEPILEGKRRWQENHYFNRQEFQNHLTAHTMGLAAIGYVLGDRDLVQFALDHPENDRDFKTLLTGMIFMPGDQPHHREPAFAPPPQRGEIHDRYRHFTAPYRGLQYAHLSLAQLVYLAELAWNNGIDFYRFEGERGENLRYSLEFYADFYRLKDASLKGGFYVQDHQGRFPGDPGYDESMDESRRISNWEAAIFEIGNRHYPNTPAIQALLQSLDRAAVPRHPHTYFFHPVLTHGEAVE